MTEYEIEILGLFTKEFLLEELNEIGFSERLDKIIVEPNAQEIKENGLSIIGGLIFDEDGNYVMKANKKVTLIFQIED